MWQVDQLDCLCSFLDLRHCNNSGTVPSKGPRFIILQWSKSRIWHIYKWPHCKAEYFSCSHFHKSSSRFSHWALPLLNSLHHFEEKWQENQSQHFQDAFQQKNQEKCLDSHRPNRRIPSGKWLPFHILFVPGFFQLHSMWWHIFSDVFVHNFSYFGSHGHFCDFSWNSSVLQSDTHVWAKFKPKSICGKSSWRDSIRRSP